MRRLRSLLLSPTEDFLQQRRRLCSRVPANLLLFLAERQEKAVERLAHNILIEIELPGKQRSAGRTADDLVVLLNDADAHHGAVNDRRKSGGQVSRTRALEVLGGSGVAARQDLAGIIDCHFLQGREKDLFGQGRGMLGGAIHANFQLVDFRAHAQHAHAASNRFELRRQQDLDGLILQKAIGPTCQSHALSRADLQRLLEAGNDLVVAETGRVAVRKGVARFLEDVVELGRGVIAAAECKNDAEQNRTPSISVGG